MSNFCRQVRISSTLIKGVQYRILRSFTTIECHRPSILHKKGVDIIHDPWFNKVLLLQTRKERIGKRSTWDFKQLPYYKSKAVCKWASTVKLTPDGPLHRHHEGRRIILVVYVDVIIITRDDSTGSSEFKLFGTAFPMTERDRLQLRGLLPPNVQTEEQQTERFMSDLKKLERNAWDGPSDTNSLAKWRILNRLHDRNETMYYKILIAHIKEYAPIVYTPTVGLVCQKYSGLFRRPRGMYFSAADRGEMMAMVYNWPADQVDMIVVTDGSRVMGLGDLGVHGIGIAIGKLDLYVAAAGINPQRVLPIMIDVGTNNETLLNDPQYLGLQEHRLEGEEYISIVDELMEALFNRWPHVIVQFEDFQRKWAIKLLQRYRNTYRMFNDDVQGTAGVAVAGLLGAVRAQERMMIDFPKQNIVVVGAASAGIGVLQAARRTMARVLGNNEDAFESARSQFWAVDVNGLITEEREDIDDEVKPFARKTNEISHRGLREGASLVEVLQEVKPDVLLGVSAVGGLFSKEVLKAFRGSTSSRPAIFAMSTPPTNAECTPEEAFSIVGKHVLFASGSPLKDVDLGNGQIGYCNQGNNMYLFPGIGLGTLLSGARIISDGMLQAAAECLAECMTEDEVVKGIIYPPISRIRDITKKVAVAVIMEAIEEDLVEGYREMNSRDLHRLSKVASNLS
ncbi:hypothetical protein OSB04_001413 [Centaurea solstitialis]|uniref:Malic enzyme n=1 Tax=Centaurea solstitialis TaxID=347529 RepID=A0AA38WLQ2_9ASTR|nr:hypothetical protein OSB04_001413 [Centaurea solstitialis]